MLGGGNFENQDKKLPGTYINFISSKRATRTLSERGYSALPLLLNWGKTGVTTIKAADFEKNALHITGYPYDHEENKPIREVFKHAHTLYAYRLNEDGAKASCTYGTATMNGTRGNDLKIVIAADVDDTDKYKVQLFLDQDKVDEQVVAASSNLVDNDFCIYNKTATLAETAGTAFTGGSNKTTITATDHQAALDELEGYTFNVLGCMSTESTIKQLYANYTKRLRNEKGIKFQTVIYSNASDFEGCINLKNKVVGEGNELKLIPWIVGAEAGCAINKSCSNMKYDGEYEIDTNYTQADLESAMDNGELVLHRMGNDVRILEDINSLVTLTEKKGEDFKYNQTIRVIDQIANEVAVLFNTNFYGQVPNDKDGRVSLRDQIVDIHKLLLQQRAIEEFGEDELVVEQGESKRAVVIPEYPVTVTNCMSQLYMTIRVA